MIRRRSSPCRADLALAMERPRLRIDGTAKQAIERGRNRLLMAGAMFLMGFAVIGLRLADIGINERTAEPRLAQSSVTEALRMDRADIVDRSGEILATSLPTDSLYADPKSVIDAEEAARKLVIVLPDLSESELIARLTSDRRFVWIRRHLTPQQKYAVNRLGIPGLSFQRDERRVYPHGNLASHILGLTDVDNRGLAGVERYFEDALAGGRTPLQLSLDIRVQHVLTEELAKAVDDFDAIGASGVVLDIDSGEVVAMASLPDYDPNLPVADDHPGRFNRATLGVYEMGSTFKVLTAAMALDAGVVTLDGGYDASKPIKIGRFTIDDYKPKHRWLSVPEIIKFSSNIGAAKMALDVGIEGQRRFLADLDLLHPVSIELPEVGRPLIPATWREINAMTIGFGHGLSVSPLQLAAAVGTIINDGVQRPLTLLKRRPGERPAGHQVIAPRTSQAMRGLLRLVVTDGTGRRAEAPGYEIGGKTGTAEKIGRQGYRKEALISSFVAAFPMSDPRYVVFVLIDEPKPNAHSNGYATGGVVAAPVIRRVVERSALFLGVSPRSRPSEMDPVRQASTSLLHKVAARGSTSAAR